MRLRTAIFPATLLFSLALCTTVLSAWALAAWLPHEGLLRRRNLIAQPVSSSGPAAPRGKPTPSYVAVHQFSRPGMVRLAWRPGLFGPTQLDTDLSPKSTIALKLPTVNQDRSWGRLPRVLASADYATVQSGGQDARGWPFLALWCELDEGVPSGHSVRGGIPLSAPGATTGSARMLPYFPIWRGLVLNTLVYAAAWFVLFLIARWIRAMIRQVCGRCIRCGYDLNGTTGPCPECGRAATGRTATRLPEGT